MPGAGGLVAANYIFNIAKPDGLTILAITQCDSLDQMVGKAEVKFDFRKFAWIGSFNKSPMMVACRSDTPYKSIRDTRGEDPAALRASRYGEHQLCLRQFDQ